jgi:hypothetical protein
LAKPEELMLADLRAKYVERPATEAFSRLYEDSENGHMFAVVHQALNRHFTAINDRAKTTHHYWADPSRDFLALIDELNEDLYALKRVGIDVKLIDSYRIAIEACEPWLSPSGGSAVPDDFSPIDVIKYEPVFSQPSNTVKLVKQASSVKLTMVGEGSYANVFSYVDPDYGFKFAVKRAKRGINDRDQIRFKQEFEVMKRLSFPYVVEVYRFDEERNEYRMEYCDETLRSYIASRNDSLSFSSRKRVALQFLYGINYLHSQSLLHRDISLQNVLIKLFGSGAVLVKLSDFGLVKDQKSDFTRTQTEMRGTIRDPQLQSFKDYSLTNEIYAVGWILSYIFTGIEALAPATDSVGKIVRKCVDHDSGMRFESVRDVIAEVESLESTLSDAPA